MPPQLSAPTRRAETVVLRALRGSSRRLCACDRSASGSVRRRPSPVLPLSGGGTRPRAARPFAPPSSVRWPQVRYAIALLSGGGTRPRNVGFVTDRALVALA